jgi:alanine racemase
MQRSIRVWIDPSALQHNLKRVHRAAPDHPVFAVIKSDAYGHGLLEAAHALADAEGFAVACLGEALTLREAGFRQRVLILQGPATVDDVATAAAWACEVMVHQPWHLEALEGYSGGIPLTVWVKLDTGMNRLGFPVDAADALERRLGLCAAVHQPVGWASHLAYADDPTAPETADQIGAFAEAVGDRRGPKSLAHSAAVLSRPDAHWDWVRPGLMLYGASPFTTGNGWELGLRPVMQVETDLIAVKECPAGGRIGYGGIFRCPEAMPVGIAAIGYGDGYPRHAISGTPVQVDGKPSQLLGRVSMDMIAVDLRGIGAVRPGCPVRVWGADLPVETIARAADTIPYELMTHLARQAVHRVYRLPQTLGPARA